jgi:hypothetical protein
MLGNVAVVTGRVNRASVINTGKRPAGLRSPTSGRAQEIAGVSWFSHVKRGYGRRESEASNESF